MPRRLFFILLVVTLFSCKEEDIQTFDVAVIGDGTGAISAAIQSARSGAHTLILNPHQWLGGMLTSAGVSATDGNHQLPSGIWGEFRDSLRKHYGDIDSLFTGWVSNTMFEPKVGAAIWNKMAKKEPNLQIWWDSKLINISSIKEGWILTISHEDQFYDVHCRIIIDGTDLGDLASQVGASYDLGMEAAKHSDEPMAPESDNDIIQDLTYVAILQDFGPAADKTIDRPTNYDPNNYHCSCKHACDDPEAHDCESMLDYGKLPNGKYMINWPIRGNDYYANVVELDTKDRDSIYEKAKNYTLGFVYYIQTELGHKNLGLAEDEFPTSDLLPLIPYHREGRRIHGLVRLSVNHLLDPYMYNLYRTNIAVGDYPIDHHHDKHPDAPFIKFPSIPSFGIPFGCLIPSNTENIIVADKAISVSNIVNGSSRLQPVIIQVGQAAGMTAALVVRENIPLRDISIRKLQLELLHNKGYILPFIDVPPEDPDFVVIQKIGATGILRGTGVPYKWANQTWFYPDSLVQLDSLKNNLLRFDPSWAQWNPNTDESFLTYELLNDFIIFSTGSVSQMDGNVEALINRRELAKMLDHYIDPFLREVDFKGELLK